MIGRIRTDVQQARRLSQVVCAVVIVAATLFSAPTAHVESGAAAVGVGVSVAGVATAAAALAARSGRAGRRSRG